MTVSQLGMVFGPIFLRPKKETNATVLHVPQVAAVGRGLLNIVGAPVRTFVK